MPSLLLKTDIYWMENQRRWEDVPKSKSLGYPDEMTKKEIDTSKKKDKDFMQQLKKSLKEKEE